MSRHGFELKTNDQIILMREAGLATAAALKAVRAAIKPGVSTLELDKIADDTINSLGGHSNFQLVPGYSHTICASINDEVVHGIPAANRILQAGDIVSIDCGAEIGEWNGDSAITVVVPGGDPEIHGLREHLSRTTETSLWVGIAVLATAEHLNEVGAAIEAYIQDEAEESGRKFGILEEYVGHGIGRSMHEDPPVFNYAVREKGPKVVPGLCVAIERKNQDFGRWLDSFYQGWRRRQPLGAHRGGARGWNLGSDRARRGSRKACPLRHYPGATGLNRVKSNI